MRLKESEQAGLHYWIVDRESKSCDDGVQPISANGKGGGSGSVRTGHRITCCIRMNVNIDSFKSNNINMKSMRSIAFFLVCCLCNSLNVLGQEGRTEEEWCNEMKNSVNRERSVVITIPFLNVTDAETKSIDESSFYHSLNGIWKFHWVSDPKDGRPAFINLNMTFHLGMILPFLPIGKWRGYGNVNPGINRFTATRSILLLLKIIRNGRMLSSLVRQNTLMSTCLIR